MASAVFLTNTKYPNWLVDVMCLKWLRNILFYCLTYWLNNTSLKYPLRMKMANEIMRDGNLLLLLSYIVFSYQFPCIKTSSDRTCSNKFVKCKSTKIHMLSTFVFGTKYFFFPCKMEYCHFVYVGEYFNNDGEHPV